MLNTSDFLIFGGISDDRNFSYFATDSDSYNNLEKEFNEHCIYFVASKPIYINGSIWIVSGTSEILYKINQFTLETEQKEVNF